MNRKESIQFAILFTLLILISCSNEPSYNVEFYKRAEEFKQKNPNVIVAADGKRVFQAKGESGVLNSSVAELNKKNKNLSNTKSNTTAIKGEVLQLNPVFDSIENVYFLGYCKNIGTRSIHYGKVTVRVFDQDKKELANSFGYCIKKQLGIQQTTPVKILFQKVPKFQSFSADLTSENLSTQDNKEPNLEISGSELHKGSSKYSFSITGKIKNIGGSEVSYPTVTGVTFNKQKKVISIDTAYITPKNLLPTNTAEFRVNVFNANGENPESFELSSDGTVKQ